MEWGLVQFRLAQDRILLAQGTSILSRGSGTIWKLDATAARFGFQGFRRPRAFHEPRSGFRQKAANICGGLPTAATPTRAEFMAREQVREEAAAFHEPPGEGTRPTGGRPGPPTRRVERRCA